MGTHQKSNPKNFEKTKGTDGQSSKRRVKNSIQFLNVGDYYRGTVKILRKVKPGPIILSIFDGTGTIDAVIHDRIFNKNNVLDVAPKTYNFGNLQIKDSRKKSIPTKTEKKVHSLTEEEIKVDHIVKVFGN